MRKSYEEYFSGYMAFTDSRQRECVLFWRGHWGGPLHPFTIVFTQWWDWKDDHHLVECGCLTSRDVSSMCLKHSMPMTTHRAHRMSLLEWWRHRRHAKHDFPRARVLGSGQ